MGGYRKLTYSPGRFGSFSVLGQSFRKGNGFFEKSDRFTARFQHVPTKMELVNLTTSKARYIMIHRIQYKCHYANIRLLYPNLVRVMNPMGTACKHGMNHPVLKSPWFDSKGTRQSLKALTLLGRPQNTQTNSSNTDCFWCSLRRLGEK